jgi:hypothetical protein
MYAQKDQDSNSGLILSLPSDHSRVEARDDRPRITGMASAAAGWAATFAAVVVGSHLGRGAAAQVGFAATQIAFAATMVTVATIETLISPAATVIIDYRVPPGAVRYRRLGALAVITGCLLGPAAAGAALGADWGTSLLATLAVACALASIAAHRLDRQPDPGDGCLSVTPHDN